MNPEKPAAEPAKPVAPGRGERRGIPRRARLSLKVTVAATVIGTAAIMASFHPQRGSDMPLVWIGWIAIAAAMAASLVFALRTGQPDTPPALATVGAVMDAPRPLAGTPVPAASSSAPNLSTRDMAIRAAAKEQSEAMIAFAQRLVQTPSLSGNEAAIARIVADEMTALGYDEVRTDRVGNVIGLLRGTGGGASIQFNSHLDHVAPGDYALWQRPPYAGIIEQDVLYGRGASDVKGALAAQVYLVPVLRAAGLRPAGDVYVVGAVLEELGGFGSEVLAAELPTTYAVLGEATNNQLRRGHRGRALVLVTFTGQSVHASAPERGHNPHFAAARFLLRLESLPMAHDATFGGSSVAPTLIGTDQTSGNVTPGTVTISLDWRNVPSETAEEILGKLQPILREIEAQVPGVSAAATIGARPVRSYTGQEATMASTRGFETTANDPLVQASQASLAGALGRPIEVGTWTFATDGGHLAHAGIKTIGFAPSEERFAHTIHDQVSLAQLREALVGNAALAIDLTALPSAGLPS